MGVYSKIISTVKSITGIRTFIGGATKDINSVWTFINGKRYLLWPDSGLELFSSGTPGEYTFTAPQTAEYLIDIVAGGGGAIAGNVSQVVDCAGGGSGGYTRVKVQITQGDVVNIVVGSGGSGLITTSVNTSASGGSISNVTVGGNIYSANGGGGANIGNTRYSWMYGLGGIGDTSNGNNGSFGIYNGEIFVANGGISVFGGYGKGGTGYRNPVTNTYSADAGGDGFVRIAMI